MKKIVFSLTILIVSVFIVGCGKNGVDKINVYTRDPASGTREAFEKGIGFDNDVNELVSTAVTSSGNGDQATKIGKDINGIGYVSLSTNMAANNIKAIRFEGVDATITNVLNDSYGLKRPFMYTTRATGDFASDNHEALVLAFIAYLGTQDGMNVLQANHAIVNPTSDTPTWESISADYDVCNGPEITIKMGGSTSVHDSIDAAADAFSTDCHAFEYQMNQTGSGDGYKRTLGSEKDANYADIGFASRPFEENENVSLAAKHGQFALDAVAIVVNENNDRIANITAEQLKKIYTGQITTWLN